MSKGLIYIVDDIYENAKLLKHILEKNDFETKEAENGKEALDIIEEEKPDLILLDVSMPVMDGFETCRRLKENPETKSIPIIFITARTAIDDVINGFKAGGADYITKPVNKRELLVRVQTHLKLQEQKNELEEKNRLLKEQEIEMQSQLIKLRKLSQSLDYAKKNLEKRQDKLKESLWYANRIQQTILPEEKNLRETLKEYFIIWQPKDIVSGDFYWVKKIDEILIIAVADCTGHGVPGAFMSIFGINFLNEIFKSNDIPEADMVLEMMREKVKLALKQKGLQNEAKDGMDISLCILNTQTKKLKFAGANNPLLIVRNNELPELTNADKKLSNSTAAIYYFKGDTQPVGIYFRERDFIQTEIELLENDMIYMYSDGYEDQFGGDNDEKYGRKRFRKLLLETSNHQVTEQKIIIEKELKTWKSNGQIQIDDIVILGFRI